MSEYDEHIQQKKELSDVKEKLHCELKNKETLKDSPSSSDFNEREYISNKFSNGDIAFKILVACKNEEIIKDIGMVNSKEDYEKKLCTHIYQPLLFIVGLELRLAYLYDCLNHQFKNPRNEEYIFMWRELRTNEWKKWFKVKSYSEDIYDRVNIIEFLCC